MQCSQCGCADKTQDGDFVCRFGGRCGRTEKFYNMQMELCNLAVDIARTIVDSPEYKQVLNTPEEQCSSEIISDLQKTMVAFGRFTPYHSSDEHFLSELMQEVKNIAVKYNVERLTDSSLFLESKNGLRSFRSILFGVLQGAVYYLSDGNPYSYSTSKLCIMAARLAKLQEADDEECRIALREAGREAMAGCGIDADKYNKYLRGRRPCYINTGSVPGPFILFSGSDFELFEKILKAAAREGINVYTHGNMDLAHASPRLRNYKNMAGHLDACWDEAGYTMSSLPGVSIVEKGCIFLPEGSGSDRIFTAGSLYVSGFRHLEFNQYEDFQFVLEKAKELKGYSKDNLRIAPSVRTVGYSRKSIEKAMPSLCEALRDGSIKRIVIMVGCDGPREFYGSMSELGGKLPADCMVWTAGCCSVRFPQHFGQRIGLFPRVLNFGSEVAESEIFTALDRIAVAMNLSVRELPVSAVVSGGLMKGTVDLFCMLEIGVNSIFFGPAEVCHFSDEVRFWLEDRNVRFLSGNSEEDAKLISSGLPLQ